MMFVLVGICVLCAVSCSSIPDMSKSPISGSFDYSTSYITEYVADERQKRAVASLIALLLGKSKLIFQYGKYRQFSRYGGYEQASKDFDHLNPKNVQDFKAELQMFLSVSRLPVRQNYICKSEKNMDDYVKNENSIHGQVGNTEVILYKHSRTVMTFLTEKHLPGGQSVTMEVDAIRYLD